MASSSTRKASSKPSRLAVIGLVLVLLSPLTVLVAIAGLKAGVFDINLAYDTITMQAGLYLAGLGVLGAILALVGAVRAFRTSWLIAVAAIVLSAATVVLFVREGSAVSGDQQYGAGGVSTDSDDPIGFSARIMAERQADVADPSANDFGPNGCQIAYLPTQTAPGVAGYALQEAGFEIRDIGINRANGVHTSFWFDRTYDAAIRIRPGRTDVRVAPRDGARDHGTSCRLAQKILTALQPSR
ncbi:hypothetical protein KOAAANKH_03362 [Brevundimonas sp. NIBR10]|nr:hypothetical protein KOAAANKH_03362 [Brevundimonas sp. NIBR10]